MIRTHKIALKPSPRHLPLLEQGATSAREGYNGALAYFKETVVKMVDFGYTLPPAISESAACAAPPPQQFKTAPPGNLTREHRTGPCPSLPASLRPQGSLNRIGSRVAASPAGVALQAPVSTAPEPHPSTSTRASPVSSRVR